MVHLLFLMGRKVFRGLHTLKILEKVIFLKKILKNS